MRTLLITCLLSLGIAAVGAAQSGSDDQDTGAPAPAPLHTAPAESLLPEPRHLTQAIDFAGQFLGGEGSVPRDGFYPDFDLMTGAGWPSLGPGYRTHLIGGRALVDGSVVISSRAYKQAQARFELPDLASSHATLGVQGRWQDFTQVNYFGLGPESLDSQRSEYRLKYSDVLAYGAVKPRNWLSVDADFGWLQKPTLGAPIGPLDRDFPSTLEVFTGEPGVADPASFLHGDVSVTADSRDQKGHPARGGVYRAAVAVYSDRDTDQFSFRRYEVEGAQIVPVVSDKWLLTVRGWSVFSDTSAGNEVPFYLMPSLGGDRTLRGYHNFRFHDRNLLMASAESRWALFRQVDAALFLDAGNVAPRVGDLDLQKISYGAGVRVHTRTATIGRMDVSHSQEGWQVFFAMSDPLMLKTRAQRNTVAPFAP